VPPYEHTFPPKWHHKLGTRGFPHVPPLECVMHTPNLIRSAAHAMSSTAFRSRDRMLYNMLCNKLYNMSVVYIRVVKIGHNRLLEPTVDRTCGGEIDRLELIKCEAVRDWMAAEPPRARTLNGQFDVRCAKSRSNTTRRRSAHANR